MQNQSIHIGVTCPRDHPGRIFYISLLVSSRESTPLLQLRDPTTLLIVSEGLLSRNVDDKAFAFHCVSRLHLALVLGRFGANIAFFDHFLLFWPE